MLPPIFLQTINNLTIISQSFREYHFSILQQLDNCIVKYLQARNSVYKQQDQQKQMQKQQEKQQQTSYLNIQNLDTLHSQNSLLLQQCNLLILKHNTDKQLLTEHNNKIIRQFLNHEHQENGVILDIVKQLSQYQNIQNVCKKVAEDLQQKGGQVSKQILGEYLKKIEKIMSDQGEEENQNYQRSDDEDENGNINCVRNKLGDFID